VLHRRTGRQGREQKKVGGEGGNGLSLLHSAPRFCATPHRRHCTQRQTLHNPTGIFHGISGSQAIIHGELLQPEFTASGMVAPFVQPVPAPSTGARFGVPSSTDVLCDNASELLR
jgi:hypothetical protein